MEGVCINQGSTSPKNYRDHLLGSSSSSTHPREPNRTILAPKDEPSQLAASATTRNIFFGDPAIEGLWEILHDSSSIGACVAQIDLECPELSCQFHIKHPKHTLSHFPLKVVCVDVRR